MNYSPLLLFLAAVVPYVAGTISDLRLCADPECRSAVSSGVATIKYQSIEPMVLSFNVGDEVTVFSKEAGRNKELWGAEIRGKRGYIPKRLIKEMRIFVRNPAYMVPTELIQPQQPIGVQPTPLNTQQQMQMHQQQPHHPQQQPIQGPKGNFMPVEQQPVQPNINPPQHPNMLHGQPMPMHQPPPSPPQQHQHPVHPVQPMQGVQQNIPAAAVPVKDTPVLEETVKLLVSPESNERGQSSAELDKKPAEEEQEEEDQDDEEEESNADNEDDDDNETEDEVPSSAKVVPDVSSSASKEEINLTDEAILSELVSNSLADERTEPNNIPVEPVIEAVESPGVQNPPKPPHLSLEEDMKSTLVFSSEPSIPSLDLEEKANDTMVFGDEEPGDDSIKVNSESMEDRSEGDERVKDVPPKIESILEEKKIPVSFKEDSISSPLSSTKESPTPSSFNEDTIKVVDMENSSEALPENGASSVVNETVPVIKTIPEKESEDTSLGNLDVIQPIDANVKEASNTLRDPETESVVTGDQPVVVDRVSASLEPMEEVSNENASSSLEVESIGSPDSSEGLTSGDNQKTEENPLPSSPIAEPSLDVTQNLETSKLDADRKDETLTEEEGSGNGGGILNSAMNWLGLSDVEEPLVATSAGGDVSSEPTNPDSLMKEIASMDPNTVRDEIVAPELGEGFCHTDDCRKVTQVPGMEGENFSRETMKDVFEKQEYFEEDHGLQNNQGHGQHQHDHQVQGEPDHQRKNEDQQANEGQAERQPEHIHNNHGHSHEPHGHSYEPHGHSHEPHGHSHEPHGHSHDHHGHSHEPHGHSHEPQGPSHEHHGHSHDHDGGFGHGHSHIPGYIPGFGHHYKPPVPQAQVPAVPDIPPPPPPIAQPTLEEPEASPPSQMTVDSLQQAETSSGIAETTETFTPDVAEAIPEIITSTEASSVVTDYIPSVEEIFMAADREKKKRLEEENLNISENSYDIFGGLFAFIPNLQTLQSAVGSDSSGTYPTVVAMAMVSFLTLYYIVQKRSYEKVLKATISHLDAQLYESQVAKEECGTAQSKATEYEAELAGLRRKLEQTEVEKIALSRKLADAEQERESLEKELESATEAGSEANRMVDELMASQKKENDQWESTVRALQDALCNQQQTSDNLNTSLCLRSAELETLSAELEELRVDCERYKVRVKTLQADLETQKTSNRNLQQKAAIENADLARLKQEKEDLLDERRSHNVNINRLTKELGEWRDKADQLSKTLKARESDLARSLEMLDSGSNTDNPAVLQLTSVIQLELRLAESNEMIQRLNREIEARGAENEQYNTERATLQSQLDQLQEKAKMAEKEKREAETRLEVLSNYFKEKETQLQKELGTHEAKRAMTEENVSESVKKILETEESLSHYKAQVTTLTKEIEEQERSYKTRLAAQEKKAHDNWVAARQLERRLEECKQEAAQLRQRLTQVEKDKEALLLAGVKENGTANGGSDVDVVKPSVKRPHLEMINLNSEDLTLMEPSLLSPPMPPPPPGMELALGGPAPPPGMPFDSLYAPPPHFMPPAPLMPPEMHLASVIPPPPAPPGMISDHHRLPPLGMIAPGSFDVDYRREISEQSRRYRDGSPPRRYPSPVGSERSNRSIRSDRSDSRIVDRYDDHFRPVSPYGRHSGRPRSVGRSRDCSPEGPRGYSPLPSPLYPAHNTINTPEEWDDRGYNRSSMMRPGGLRQPPQGPKTSSPLVHPMDTGDRQRQQQH